MAMGLPNISGLGKEEGPDSSDLTGGAIQGHDEDSLSGCDSSSSVLTDAMQAESKTFDASISLETAWTDSKHSSYLDFMEAKFVQNMFARCYCMEDVCGETSDNYYHRHHHQQQQCQSRIKYEGNDYDSAQSQLHSNGSLEYIHDGADWRSRPVSRFKARSGISASLLLANPWVKHFRPKSFSSVRSNSSTLRSKGNHKLGRGEAHHLETACSLETRVDEDGQRFNRISASEEPMKVVRKISELEAGQMKDHIWSHLQNDMAYRSISKSKRRILWLTYKQVHKVRQRTRDHVQHGISVNQDDMAASTFQ